jgi:spore coat polysaccharide biosynthesis protein SpsF
MSQIVASIQVRMGSSRYSGKVMYETAGRPLLGHLISRLQKSKLLDDIVVATSVNPENDTIESYCQKNAISCFRGDEDDVLGRTLGALHYMNAEIGVEVFGDCPLIDPVIVDMIIRDFLNDKNKPEFVGNDLKTTFPPGMDVEVFRVSALEDAAKRITDPSIREHGTLYIRQNPSLYKVKNIEAPEKWYRPELELEVDTEEDIYVVSKIFEYFRALNNENFGIDDIIEFMDGNPDLKKINAEVPRRWKKVRGDDNL